jgi:hypothetical protein
MSQHKSVQRELYVSKVRSWSLWRKRVGSGKEEVHVVVGRANITTLLRFADRETLERFRDAIDQIDDEVNP